MTDSALITWSVLLPVKLLAQAKSRLATLAGPRRGQLALAVAQVHGYTTAFWWTAGIFAAGGVVCASLMRWGPLARQAGAEPAMPAGQPAAGPSVPA